MVFETQNLAYLEEYSLNSENLVKNCQIRMQYNLKFGKYREFRDSSNSPHFSWGIQNRENEQA